MTTPDRAADRRRIAEAMGWRLMESPSTFWGNDRRDRWEYCWTDECMSEARREPPDPWADDAAAWGLMTWIRKQGWEPKLADSDTKTRVVCTIRRGSHIIGKTGESDSAALCAAVPAWIESQEQNESQRCGEHAPKPDAGGKAGPQ